MYLAELRKKFEMTFNDKPATVQMPENKNKILDDENERSIC